jgi:hypothetical protein
MFFQKQRAPQRALPFQTRINPQVQPQAQPQARPQAELHRPHMSSRGGETPKLQPMRFIINAPPSAGSCSACGH